MEEVGPDHPEAKDLWFSLHQLIGFAKVLEPMSAVAVENLPPTIRLRPLLDLLAAAMETLQHMNGSNFSLFTFHAKLQRVLADIDEYRNAETSRVLALHRIVFGAVAGSLYVRKSLPGDRTGTTALLGNGKFGATYRMKNTEIDEISKPLCLDSFAVKEIDVALAENRGVSPKSLHEEVAAEMAVAHVNIARCYGYFSTEGGEQLSVIMELADGGSIADFVRHIPRPSEAVITKWVTQAASALACLHAQGLLHGELRPENMLLTHGKDVKLINIRFTRQDDSLPQRAYVSPERFSGGDYDGRDDVWALGCVLLELLTSKRLAEAIEQPLCRADLVHICREREALLEAATERSATLGGEVLPLMLAVHPQQRASSAQVLQLLAALSARPASYPAVRQRLLLKLGANVWVLHLQDVWKCLRICVYAYVALLLLLSTGPALLPSKSLTAWGCSTKLQGSYLAEAIFPGSVDCSSARRDSRLLAAFAQVAAATSGDVQDSALQAVWSTFEDIAAVHKRDVESLTSLLYSASDAAQHTGSELLSAIATEHSFCASCLMGDTASMPIYVKLMLVGSDATKTSAAARLLELTQDLTRGSRPAAARAGVLPALSALLEFGSPAAQESATGILLNLTSEPDKHESASPQLRYILLCRVSATVSDFIARTAGLGALRHLGVEALSAEYCRVGRWSWAQIADCIIRWGGDPAAPDSAQRRSEMVVSGLLPLLVGVLSGDRSSGNGGRAQEYAAGVAKSLAADAYWKQTLVQEPRMVQSLVSLLSATSDAARTYAALALWDLAAHSSDSQRVLAEAGAADALAQAAMSGSATARSAAHSALKALSVHWGDQLKSIA